MDKHNANENNIDFIKLLEKNDSLLINKFEMLSLSVAQYVDILISSETKLDSTFPSTKFLINCFSAPHQLDRNSKGGGIK